MKRKLTAWIIWYMVTVMFLFGITPKIEAGFSPSELIGQSQIIRSTDVGKIQNFLENRDRGRSRDLRPPTPPGHTGPYPAVHVALPNA